MERYQQGDGKVFVQRLPGAAKAGLPHGFQPALYRLPQVLAEARSGGTVYVVEGEKCVHAMESLGVVATTGPNGAGKWKPYFGDWLKGAEVVIVVDNDEPGREHARIVRENLRDRKVPHRVMGPRLSTAKADVYDHVKAGYGITDLVEVDLDRTRPKAAAFVDLLRKQYPPVKWAVKDLISTGLHRPARRGTQDGQVPHHAGHRARRRLRWAVLLRAELQPGLGAVPVAGQRLRAAHPGTDAVADGWPDADHRHPDRVALHLADRGRRPGRLPGVGRLSGQP